MNGYNTRESSGRTDPVKSGTTLKGQKIRDDHSSQPNSKLIDLSMIFDSPILEDLTLGFSSPDEMKKFLTKARANGFQIREIRGITNGSFKSYRLRYSFQYFARSEYETEPQFNHQVRSPELPRAEFLEERKASGLMLTNGLVYPKNRSGDAGLRWPS